MDHYHHDEHQAERPVLQDETVMRRGEPMRDILRRHIAQVRDDSSSASARLLGPMGVDGASFDWDEHHRRQANRLRDNMRGHHVEHQAERPVLSNEPTATNLANWEDTRSAAAGYSMPATFVTGEVSVNVKREDPPFCNTGGTQLFRSSVLALDSASKRQKTIIDTVSWTIPDQQGDVEDTAALKAVKFSRIRPILAAVLAAFPAGIEWTAVAEGKQGYQYQTQLVSGSLILGWLAFGAPHGKHWLYIDGTGLRLRRDHGFTDDSLAAFTDMPGARLGRVDIALDIYDHATFSVDMSIAALASGGYELVRAPRRPHEELFQSSTKSDAYPVARTHYVGARAGKKRLRVYDKGLQLLGSLTAEALASYQERGVVQADPTPEGANLEEWTRVEIIYKHDKKRPLDNQLILDRDQMFAGGYPVLAQLLDRTDGIRPSYIPKDEDCEHARMIEAHRDSYGGHLYFMHHDLGWSAERILTALIGTKSAARLMIDKERTD
jgi:DNA relaxase NicK